MNLNLVVFGALTLFFLGSALFRPNWVFFAMPVCVGIFQYARAVMGPLPVYLTDVAVFAALVAVVRSGAPAGLTIPHERAWHWWFLLMGVASALLASLRFGILVEASYDLVRSALTWGLLGATAWIFGLRRLESGRAALGWGVLTTTLTFLALEVYQFGSAARTLQIKSFLLGDVRKQEALMYAISMHRDTILRPSGPMHVATAAAGTGLLLGALGWLCLRERNAIAANISVAAGVACAGLTLSRHGALAVAVALPFALAAGDRHKTGTRSALRVVGVVLLLGGLLALVGDAWSRRLEQRGSMMTDSNILLRVVEGPARYLSAISEDPALLVSGVGPGAHKARFVEGAFELRHRGINSNGFLLVLLYYGVFGFLLFLALFRRVTQAALALRPSLGGQGLAIVVLASVIIVSDNYGVLDKATMRIWVSLFGALLGMHAAAPTAALARPVPATPLVVSRQPAPSP